MRQPIALNILAQPQSDREKRNTVGGQVEIFYGELSAYCAKPFNPCAMLFMYGSRSGDVKRATRWCFAYINSLIKCFTIFYSRSSLNNIDDSKFTVLKVLKLN